MTTEELLGQLYDETLTGNRPAVLELTNQGLAQGLGPETLLYEALIPSLEEVGARFERGDFFVPEMLIAGKAMAGALEVLRPLLAETGAESIGTVVMGTVKGDVHDIALDRAHHDRADRLRAGLGQQRPEHLECPGHRLAGDQHLGDEEVAALEPRADLLERGDQRYVQQRLGAQSRGEPRVGELEHGRGVPDQGQVI